MELVIDSIVHGCLLDHGNDRSLIHAWLSFHRSYFSLGSDGEVMGLIVLNNNNRILLNYVRSDVFRNGVGKRLLNEVTKRHLGVGVLRVQSTLAARKFYLQQGFQASKMHTQELHLPTCDSLILDRN